MDTLTHALSGALLARASAPARPGPDAASVRQRVAFGFLAAAFPDSDVLLSFASPLTYLTQHRGATHSLLLLPLWAWLLAWIAARLLRHPGGWRAFFGVAALSIAIHIAGDLITSFGTMILAPFSDLRFALGTTFIIDPWFTGILLLGLAGSAVWRRARLPALAGLAILAGYVGGQWLLLQQAVSVGERFAAAQGWSDARVVAYPRPPLPVNFTILVSREDDYRMAHVNLLRREPVPPPPADAGLLARLDAPFQPVAQARWQAVSRFGNGETRALARQVWALPGLHFFRWFADAPALYRVDAECVWFQDLRFLTPGREAMPFRYGACRSGQDSWRPYQLQDEGGRLPVS